MNDVERCDTDAPVHEGSPLLTNNDAQNEEQVRNDTQQRRRTSPSWIGSGAALVLIFLVALGLFHSTKSNSRQQKDISKTHQPIPELDMTNYPLVLPPELHVVGPLYSMSRNGDDDDSAQLDISQFNPPKGVYRDTFLEHTHSTTDIFGITLDMTNTMEIESEKIVSEKNRAGKINIHG